MCLEKGQAQVAAAVGVDGRQFQHFEQQVSIGTGCCKYSHAVRSDAD